MENLTIKQLKEKIESQLKNIKGDYAVAFKSLVDTSDVIFINENENFHAASTMKTPVMIEVFKQAAEGKLKLTDSILVKNEFKSLADGSSFKLDIDRDGGESLYKSIGGKMSIYDLVYDMITVSSNLATNILIELVEAKNVSKTMRQLGANKIKVMRGVEDMKAYDLGMNNTTTALDLLIIFEKIANSEIISAEACREMIKILADQKFNEVIPAHLPGNIKVAHKTGSVDGVQHDSGIIILPDGEKYVLVLLTKNLESNSEAIKVLANVSKEIYDYITNKKL